MITFSMATVHVHVVHDKHLWEFNNPFWNHIYNIKYTPVWVAGIFLPKKADHIACMFDTYLVQMGMSIILLEPYIYI